MKDLTKAALGYLGARFSSRTIHQLNAAISYLETGRWLREKSLYPQVRVSSNTGLFDLIINRISSELLLYLEFGVFEGNSMRYWSNHVKHPKAILHGFDSFEGLPEEWNIDSPKGHFSTDGNIPDIPDPRVTLYKGWFEESLPKYIPPSHERLVVNMDADLYSSTRYVLNFLHPYFAVGSYIYFDEFADRFNELKAFAEFAEATAWKFDLVGVNQVLSKVVFQRVG